MELPLEELAVFLDLLVEGVTVPVVEPLPRPAVEPDPEGVHRRPHLETHGLADGAGILARVMQGRHQGHGVPQVPAHVVLDGFAVVGVDRSKAGEEALLLAGRLQHRPPAATRGHGRIEQKGEVHLQQAGGVLGPLHVALQPEAVLCDPGDHAVSGARTQVSLEPPP